MCCLPGVGTFNRCWIFCGILPVYGPLFPSVGISPHCLRITGIRLLFCLLLLLFFILFFSVRDAYYNRPLRRPAQEECRITKLSLIHIILYIISDNKMHTDVRAHHRGGRPSSACVYEYLHRSWGRGYSPRNKTQAPGEVNLEKKMYMYIMLANVIIIIQHRRRRLCRRKCLPTRGPVYRSSSCIMLYIIVILY